MGVVVRRYIDLMHCVINCVATCVGVRSVARSAILSGKKRVSVRVSVNTAWLLVRISESFLRTTWI